ncbi:MAG: histone deacetylase [Peptococcaceae bacterium]|jgi:acetoin utilization deacetylase AcuC-like enzyme|nr:histone deacetylase [Peptococcaceae bacterium]
MKKTGIVFFPAFDWSLGETHPEREERLLYTQEQIFEEGVMDLPQIKQYSPAVANIQDVLRTQAVFPSPKHHELDAHLIAVGCSLVLGKALMAQEISNGFVLVRPPGHHSATVVWGNRGFCTLNNEAILANYLRTYYGVKKIAIIDTDVHHGDGTQDIFYYDPNVLCISIHQDGRTLYPGTGFCEEKGGPNSWGNIVNIPLSPGTGDEGFIYALEKWALPAVEEFKPDIIINSAGQDNHFTDPLASMNVTAKGYGKITEMIRPDLAVLEGGYSIQGALPYVNLAILLALAGEDYSGVREPQKINRRVLGGEKVRSYIDDLYKYFQQIKPNWRYAQGQNKHLPAGKWVSVEKEIFYDTEMFREQRHDLIRECQHCGGTVFIRTRNQATMEKAMLVKIPFEACPACEQAGYDLVEHYKKSAQTLLLQNQLRNQVLFWENGKEVNLFASEN